MTLPKVFLAAFAVGALVYTQIAIGSLRNELAATQDELTSTRALNDQLLAKKLDLETTVKSAAAFNCPPCAATGQAVPPQQVPAAAPASARPEPVETAPDGTKLMSEKERDEFVRRHLADRIAEVFPDDATDGLSIGQQNQAVRLLLTAREIRKTMARRTTPSPLLEDDLADTEEEFDDLTGMRMGEFMQKLSTPEGPNPTESWNALPPADGEVRKRFADETSRMLGITDPGSVERYEDGRWKSDD